MTGGAGFIGCAIASRLAADAERWVAVDSLHPQVHSERRRPADLVEASELVVGDVTDPEVWDALLADWFPETVIHLAAETGTAQSLEESSRHAEVNVLGTTRMLDAFSARGRSPRRILLASSRAVYGEGEWELADRSRTAPGMRTHAQLAAGEWDFPGAVPLPSEAGRTVPHPTSVYGATKLAQEHILEAWSGSRGVELGVLRLQNVYGPGQSLTNPYTGIVSLFSRIAASGRAIEVYEDGLIGRDFVYIDDVADAFAALYRSPEFGTGFYDVGSGRRTTILELAELIAAYHGAPAPVVVGKFRDGDVRSAACRIDAMEAAFDWRPRWSLEDGIAALQRWIDAQ